MRSLYCGVLAAILVGCSDGPAVPAPQSFSRLSAVVESPPRASVRAHPVIRVELATSAEQSAAIEAAEAEAASGPCALRLLRMAGNEALFEASATEPGTCAFTLRVYALGQLVRRDEHLEFIDVDPLELTEEERETCTYVRYQVDGALRLCATRSEIETSSDEQPSDVVYARRASDDSWSAAGRGLIAQLDASHWLFCTDGLCEAKDAQLATVARQQFPGRLRDVTYEVPSQQLRVLSDDDTSDRELVWSFRWSDGELIGLGDPIPLPQEFSPFDPQNPFGAPQRLWGSTVFVARSDAWALFDLSTRTMDTFEPLRLESSFPERNGAFLVFGSAFYRRPQELHSGAAARLRESRLAALQGTCLMGQEQWLPSGRGTEVALFDVCGNTPRMLALGWLPPGTSWATLSVLPEGLLVNEFRGAEGPRTRLVRWVRSP